jgi:hypothetical protein
MRYLSLVTNSPDCIDPARKIGSVAGLGIVMLCVCRIVLDYVRNFKTGYLIRVISQKKRRSMIYV